MSAATIVGRVVVVVTLAGLVGAQAPAAPKLAQVQDGVAVPLDRLVPLDSAPPAFTHVEDDVVVTELGGPAVYDNGSTHPNTESGNEMSQWVQADDFELAGAATLTGAEVDWFDINTGNQWDGGIEWYLFADAGGSPGAMLDLGTGSVRHTTLISHANGWDWFTTSFTFDHPVLLAGDTRTWFGLHWADDHAYFRDRVFWANSQEQHFETSQESLFAEFDNWEAFSGEDRAFRLFGELESVTLDFSTSDQGALSHGQDLETAGETFGCVSIAGSPIGGGPPGNAGAAIFDSTAGPAGQDPDLMVGRGNLLILQNNQNAQVLSKSNDSYIHPNDDHDGGTLTFTFCQPADATTIDLIDIDDANGPGSPDGATVVLTDVGGLTHTIAVPDGWTANGGVGVLDLETLAAQPGISGAATASEQAGYDGTQVVSIAVTLASSGAVDDLCYSPNGLPASATVRNGSGSNPLILRPLSLPVLGGTWRASLDCTASESGLALVIVCRSPRAGTMTPFGEALIGGALVHRTIRTVHRSVSPVAWDIPYDLSLYGVEVHAQGFCRGLAIPSRPKTLFLQGRLSNAVDLVLGFGDESPWGRERASLRRASPR